ncbi:MAG: bifunctional hydroxymethylpyrimidine kinase/phosphomethylpyrimidine kinase [Candidatus Euphemobacter frigidus]|nr:bifunctional hydroxymethylpyrimidine kinase/phosphomethylpyrimidine kinase [Candidatus Euphemobacter frigidus]
MAGSDSGGGAGIQADLKTFQVLGVFGASAITAVTAQNTRGVKEIFTLSPALVEKQIDAVMEDIAPQAVKVGMLGEASIIEAVARKAKEYAIERLVVDPVMVASSGAPLLDPAAVGILKSRLLPLALVVTPNLAEAGSLAGFPVSTRQTMEKAARVIREMGPRYVVIKGGHRSRDADDLFFDGREAFFLRSPRFTGKKLHGTGCTFSAAITAGLARGLSPRRAITEAKSFMMEVLKNPLKPGHGAYTPNLFLRDFL